MFDAHCHLDDERFADDLTAVLARARTAGVQSFISAGYSPERWRRQSTIATQEEGVYVAYGIHPWHVSAHMDEPSSVMLAALDACLSDDVYIKPVGIGEIGLDRSHYVEEASYPLQVEVFRAQLALAREKDLPVVIHAVKTHADVLSFLKKDGVPKRGGQIHAFSASIEIAREYVKLGMSLSFGGAVTRPHAKRARTAAYEIPGEMLLCETDAPDMTPPGFPHRRNEPTSLPLVLQSIAELREIPLEEAVALTSQNTKHLFAIED
ncbi:MAG TPA: hypothetical protein DCE42_24655 [Myxococcales bacterium]|nr:hypothetical protein [Deltaproteobacteria bacterium]MBU50504.1 hypothetical protein [Deltaproteobacteria bacterium]HAA57979.1 hypothetical protein [Myxococcales bacterium]|tara:strand:+ start:5455 stop:6249 length:795 start_codon:yes stop_codon:yes gene_type:complete